MLKKNNLIFISLLAGISFGFTSCNDPKEEVCGNNILDSNESCDGLEFGSNTCEDIASLGEYAGGFLDCNTNCTLDVTTCDLNYGYPEEPATGFGTEIGDIIEDLDFELGNTDSVKFANRNRDNKQFSLNHLYRENINKGGKWKGVLLFFTTGWCPYCSYEALILTNVTYEYKEQGILFVGIVLEDNYYAPATGTDAQVLSDDYGWRFPAVAGDIQVLGKYWPGGYIGFPMNMLLDLDTMEIKAVQTGALMNNSRLSDFIAPVLN